MMEALKLKIKHWEHEFLKDNGRKPTKSDVACAPLSIQDAYRNYCKLKTKPTTEVRQHQVDSVCVWDTSLNKTTEVDSVVKPLKSAATLLLGNVRPKYFDRCLRRHQRGSTKSTNDAVEENGSVATSVATPVVISTDVQPKLSTNVENHLVKSSCFNSDVDEDDGDEDLEAGNFSGNGFRVHVLDDSTVSCKAVNLISNGGNRVERRRRLTLTCEDDVSSGEVEPSEVAVESLRLQGAVATNVETTKRRRQASGDDNEATSPRSKRLKTKLQQPNYVRINLKKKVFCRGSRKFNFRRYKFARWKQLKKNSNYRKQIDAEAIEDNQVTDQLPGQLPDHNRSTTVDDDLRQSCQVEDVGDQKLSTGSERKYSTCEPIFTSDELPPDVEDDVYEALKLFGHDDFRCGQLAAIRRILAGKSTLLVQPTGAGKSLCYLLPALIYARRRAAMTLVVSPLLALMDDQVSSVPKKSGLRVVSFHAGLTRVQRDKVCQAISEGSVDVLMTSPEMLVGGGLPFRLQKVAFVCIDEVHCVSAWAHNFRPSYLRLCRVLCDVMGVRCVLGLTATVGCPADVLRHLPDTDSDKNALIQSDDVIPDNLFLSVTTDDRESGLISVLESVTGSVLVYCIRREQTERLASLIRTVLRKATAEAYHAGLSAAQRRSIQTRFMSGKVRIVVATVAFGMGLNKPDVRAVVHYGPPASIEAYVQEIGRAGRDRKPAVTVMFLDPRGCDRNELRRHIHADAVDRVTVKRLLTRVFERCHCAALRRIEAGLEKKNDEVTATDVRWRCQGHEVAIDVEETVEELDTREEVIDTLLCYLEAHPSSPIRLFNRTQARCIVIVYGGGVARLARLAQQIPALAVALALQRKRAQSGPSNRLEFDLVRVARAVGQDSTELRRQLAALKWTTEVVDGVVKYRPSDLVVTFSGNAFHLKAVGDLADDELDGLVDHVHGLSNRRERTQLARLERFHSDLQSVSCERIRFDDPARSAQLKNIITAHFRSANDVAAQHDCVDLISTVAEMTPCDDDVIAMVRRFLSIHGDDGRTKLTGRAVARIFHGIGSPRFPAQTWGQVRQFWRSRLDVDFNALCRVAANELLSLK